ncbi:hypothetical protein A4G28_04145 [Mycobacterium ostraviense]|uniref:Uncharacterized protein n=2 Tax=Mycobacterium ostraviense TaxID=2738409 RepID=A0A164DR45_9MYCO|nr:hypothetical protein A4G28_04145 [Mycobacterium ostraviense]
MVSSHTFSPGEHHRYNLRMGDNLRVDPAQLRVTSTRWHMEAFDLHAAPPALEPSGGWPSVLAAAGVTGAAQVATADLHTNIATTAGMTQVAATGYEVTDSDAADMLKNVVTTSTGTARSA